MCLEETRRLPGAVTSPGEARQFVRRILTSCLPPGGPTDDVLDGATLVVSELVTNAVNAGGSSVDVTVLLHRDQLRLTVRDDASGRAVVMHPSNTDNHGRGLIMVQRVSPDWGVDYRDGGKDVWVDIFLSPALAATVDCSRLTG